MPADTMRNSTPNWRPAFQDRTPWRNHWRGGWHEPIASSLSFPSLFSQRAILASVHPSTSAGFQPLFKQSSGKQRRVTRREGASEDQRSGGREGRRMAKREPSNGISIYSWRLISSSLLFPPRESSGYPHPPTDACRGEIGCQANCFCSPPTGSRLRRLFHSLSQRL